jgi:hypothetical protein
MFFYLFHRVFYWVLSSSILKIPIELDAGQMLFFGVLNAVVGVFLFNILDRVRTQN